MTTKGMTTFRSARDIGEASPAMSDYERACKAAADQIILMGKIRRGEVHLQQLDIDPVAQAILDAGRKRRGEI
jgi:hypothetical protein